MWNTILRNKGLLFALALAVILPHRALAAACTTGQATCVTDTVNDALIAAAIRDPIVQLRVYQLWLGRCQNVWTELASTAGNVLRANFCTQIAGGGISKELLVAVVMNATVQSEILGACALPPGVPTAAGCMVDVDVNTAIDTALTVTVSSASTTATAVAGSTLLTVASAVGIAPGQSVSGAGITANTTVQFVSGTSVAISLPTTAALTATPVLFTVSTGLP